MDLLQSLTRRRSIPEVPAWVASAALLLLAGYAGWAAVRPEGPPVMGIREPDEVLQDSRELLAQGDALMQAVRENDERQIEKIKAEFEARSRREADREDKRTSAVAAARRWYGVIAALNFAVGVWLLVAGRGSWPD
jgi:hypothetical protein